MKERDRLRIAMIRMYCGEIAESMTRNGSEYDSFVSNIDYYNSIGMFLLQIGEQVSSLPREFKDAHPEIAWSAIRGMRNAVVHDYGHLQSDIIWDTITNDVPHLIQFCENILNAEEKS